jgi:hypothetical protein
MTFSPFQRHTLNSFFNQCTIGQDNGTTIVQQSTYDMSFSVAEQQTRDTTATNSPCPNKILRIASLHTVLTFEVNDVAYTIDKVLQM